MDDRPSRSHRMYRTVDVHLRLALLCALLFVGRTFADIPYSPTSVLYTSQQNGSFAYILRPSNSNPGRTEFLSLNVSGAVDTSDPSYTILLEDAPFRYNDNPPSSYIPVVDQSGIVRVYKGNCQDSNGTGELWKFTPDPSSLIGNGTWEEFPVRGAGGQASSDMFGPNYLSAGFVYSPSNTTESSLYAFAGMCPLAGDFGTNWAGAANYSQSMVVLDPLASDGIHFYQASTIGDRAPPIPEAGLTITPLRATYAYSAEELRQQQDFLLIGGHTQQAFINMSQLAIFSTPQNSWSFITVESVDETQQTELAVREVPVIEPRSGHTAVLSPDGNKVIVCGGWVGNTTVPATPQLAILEIGEGYLGSGEWIWKVPSTSNAGIPENTGIYGHGAAILPGGVMMIAGGYQISQSTKRSLDGPELNSKIYLYNVTSDSWASSYENPLTAAKEPAANASPSSSHSSSSFPRKTGLGVGLGLGIPAVAAVAVLSFFFCRKSRVRRTRDKELRKLALGAERPHFWGRDERSSSICRPDTMEIERNSAYPWNNNPTPRKQQSWDDNGDAVAERTGLLGETTSPTKFSRPALNARMYRPPSSYHERSRSDATGDIHPIDEREEDDIQVTERPDTRDTVDPFVEESPSLSPGETRAEELRRTLPPTEQSEPVAGAGSEGERCSLPDKSDRTSSSLSDSSTSAKSSQFSGGSLPPSGRQSPNKLPSRSREALRSQDSTTASSSHEKRYSSDSFSTAYTSLSQRQLEGEQLLQPEGASSLFLDRFPQFTSNPRPRASEWIGNVRRVLSVTRRRPAAADTSLNTNDGAFLASGVDGSNKIIGIPGLGTTRVPQRSVSASAELFRRKQGAKDWGADPRASRETPGFQPILSTRDDFALDGLMGLDEEEDWDVEGAAEGRRVQVTFTVPKEKLRVVNATASDLDGISEKSISRSNSSGS